MRTKLRFRLIASLGVLALSMPMAHAESSRAGGTREAAPSAEPSDAKRPKAGKTVPPGSITVPRSAFPKKVVKTEALTDLEPGTAVSLSVPGDKPVLVVHAPLENRRAIVYLHGMCGNLRAVESWKAAAARHGTLIGLLGDRACGGGRFKWSKTVEPIQARIERALQAVSDARGGELDISEVVLFGYSMGADRASVLARRFPGKYRRVVLGGPSRQPQLANLGETEAVAVFGGEFETTWHMRNGAEVLSAAGKPARFFLLPSAKHGEFGPEGDRVMNEVLDWVLHDSEEGRGAEG